MPKFSYLSQCKGKIQFSTKQKAKAFIKGRSKYKSKDLVIYKCAHCLYYHLGHKVNHD